MNFKTNIEELAIRNEQQGYKERQGNEQQWDKERQETIRNDKGQAAMGQGTTRDRYHIHIFFLNIFTNHSLYLGIQIFMLA